MLPNNLFVFIVIQFNVLIYLIPFIGIDKNETKGCNKITKGKISSYYLFDENEVAHDVTIILGLKEMRNLCNEDVHLLHMRFHKYTPVLSRKKKQTVQKLYNDLRKVLKNDGLERRRRGGSSGFVSYNENLKKMMKSHNVSPRNSKGIFLIYVFLFMIEYNYHYLLILCYLPIF